MSLSNTAAKKPKRTTMLVEKVIVTANDLEVRLRANGIERLVTDLRNDHAEIQPEEAMA